MKDAEEKTADAIEAICEIGRSSRAECSQAAHVETAEDRFWSYLRFNADQGFATGLGRREVEWVIAAYDGLQRARAKIDLIQKIQFEDMPEPWRTRVCDVIANGVDRGAGTLLGECTIDLTTGEIVEPENKDSATGG